MKLFYSLLTLAMFAFSANFAIANQPVDGVEAATEATFTGTPKLEMYPNPNRGDRVTVQVSNIDPSTVRQLNVTILNNLGQRVLMQDFRLQNERVFKQQLSLLDIKPGIYVVQVTIGDKVISDRLVVRY